MIVVCLQFLRHYTNKVRRKPIVLRVCNKSLAVRVKTFFCRRHQDRAMSTNSSTSSCRSSSRSSRSQRLEEMLIEEEVKSAAIKALLSFGKRERDLNEQKAEAEKTVNE